MREHAERIHRGGELSDGLADSPSVGAVRVVPDEDVVYALPVGQGPEILVGARHWRGDADLAVTAGRAPDDHLRERRAEGGARPDAVDQYLRGVWDIDEADHERRRSDEAVAVLPGCRSVEQDVVHDADAWHRHRHARAGADHPKAHPGVHARRREEGGGGRGGGRGCRDRRGCLRGARRGPHQGQRKGPTDGSMEHAAARHCAQGDEAEAGPASVAAQLLME